MPWQQREDDESSELDNMPATDNTDHSDNHTEPSQQQGDISEQDQTTTESAVSLVTPDNPYGIDPSKPMVALTFDDGPSKYTWPIVSALAQHNARATFFMVGNRVATHEAAIDFLLENNQEVATHSFSHANLVNCDDEELLSQIQKPDKALQKQHDYTPHLFRVPYGERDERVLEALRQQGKPAIGWSVDPREIFPVVFFRPAQILPLEGWR
ncbi:MAG: polysaccharide deacetylase family protein [Peptococcaceae bacterium]|nr:polysaccharide deacetylase family protein [Peptococcaceae bacterium]